MRLQGQHNIANQIVILPAEQMIRRKESLCLFNPTPGQPDIFILHLIVLFLLQSTDKIIGDLMQVGLHPRRSGNDKRCLRRV